MIIDNSKIFKALKRKNNYLKFGKTIKKHYICAINFKQLHYEDENQF